MTIYYARDGAAGGGGGGGRGYTKACGGCSSATGVGGVGKVEISYHIKSFGDYSAVTDWTIPADVTAVAVHTWGGGGAGGGSDGSNNEQGSGGGGGAYAYKVISDVTTGATYSVTIGAGGVGASNATGGNGGDTYFSTSVGTSLVVADGGSGGGANSGTRGAGGLAGNCTGDITASGGQGGLGATHSDNECPGPGGASAGWGATYLGEAGGAGPDSPLIDAGGESSGDVGGTAPTGGTDGADAWYGSWWSDHASDGDDGGAGGAGCGHGTQGTDAGGNGGNGKVMVDFGPLYTLGSDPVAADAAVPASNPNYPIHKFTLKTDNYIAPGTFTLTDVDFTTTGTYTTDDVTLFELYYSATDDFSAATSIGTAATAVAGDHTFTGLTQTFTSNATFYFWIVADISSTACTRTIQVSAMANRDITMTVYGNRLDGNLAGAATGSGLQTFYCTYPGDVGTDLHVWYKADGGVSGATPITQWDDHSSAGADLTVDNGSPDLTTDAINYNPAMDFTDPDALTYAAGLLGVTTINDIAIFYVAQKDASTDDYLFGEDCSGTQFKAGIDDGANHEWAVPLSDVMNYDYTTSGWVEDYYNIHSYMGSSVAATNALGTGLEETASMDGKQLATDATFTPFTGDNSPFYLGVGSNGTNQNYEGKIAEFFIYTTVPTEQEMMQINTYLAIKYGITLTNDIDGDSNLGETYATSYEEGDYIATDGTVVWDYSEVTATYHNDVAGIGRDDNEALGQVKSKSHNTDGILYVEADGEGTNSANTFVDMDDKEYLIWGNNNGSASWTETNAPSGYVKSTRTWLVEENDGDVGTCTFAFDVADADFNIPPLQSGAVYYIIYEVGDSDFSAGATTSALTNSGGDIWEIDLNMADNTYFTIASEEGNMPGGVGSNIQIWLKADAGVTGTTPITDWADQSGNSVTMTENGSVNLTDAAASSNFNDVISLVGVTDYLTSDYAFDPNTTDFTVYAVWNSDDGGADQIIWRNLDGTGTGSDLMFIDDSATDLAIDVDGTDYNAATARSFATWNLSTSRSDISATTVNLYNEGKMDYNNAALTPNAADGNLRIGANEAGTGSEYDGNFGELIMYDFALAASDRQKIETYLAIKWGITLDGDNDGDGTDHEASNAEGIAEGDYVDADDNVIWDASANSTYSVSIAGIGVDADEGLDQKQSNSINSGVQPVIGNADEIAADNSSHTTSIAVDQSYLIWGCDGTSTEFATAFSSGTMNYRMTRIWKVQQSGTVGSVKVAILQSDVPGNVESPYLIVSGDGNTTFGEGGSDAETAMSAETINSIDYYTCTYDLDNGDYFTFAGTATYPGGVLSGLKIWMKADAGVTTSGSDVTAWQNQAAGNESFTNQTANEPLYNSNNAAWNFNPSIEFQTGLDGLEYIVDAGEIFADADELMAFFAVNKDGDTRGTLCQMGENDYPAWEVNLETTAGKFGVIALGTDFNGDNGEHTTATVTTGENTLITSGWNNGVGAAGRVVNYKNGADKEELSAGSDGYNDVGNGIAHDVSFGANDDNNEELDGTMPEVIIYNEYDLTDAQIQRINTYLAIKYGVTIDGDTDGDGTDHEEPNGDGVNEGDYVDTEGNVIWDASANSTYSLCIAGIGRDDIEDLGQIKSKSQSANGIVTFHATGEGTSNAAADITWDAMADHEYFVWGSENGTATFTAGGPGSLDLLDRVWKVQESTGDGDGDVGDLLFSVDVEDADFNIPAGSENYVLVIDTDLDGNFDDETTIALYDDGTNGDVASGDDVWSISGVNMASGSLFTLGDTYDATLAQGNSTTGFLCNTATKESVYYFTVAIDAGPGDRGFTGLSFTTDGSYVAADIDQFELWYHTSNDLASATKISADLTPTGGNGTTETFAVTSTTLTASATSHFWIVVDVDADATDGNVISINAIDTDNFTMKAGRKIGTATAGSNHFFNAKIWDGGGGDANWTTAANWLGDVAPVADDNIAFGGAVNTDTQNDFAGGTNFASVTFVSGASSFTVSGNDFTITSAGCTTSNAISAENTGNTMTIESNITFSTNAPTIACTQAGGTLNIEGTIDNGGLAVTNNITGTATYSGIISGAGLLTKSGTGALTLSGVNTMTGGVTLSAGTLNIANAQALGTIAGTFTIADGTTIDATGGNISTLNYPQAWNGDFTFTGSNDLDLGTGAVAMSANRQITASASNLTVGGVISGGFSLTKLGGGTLTLEGTNTFTGGVTLSAGTLNIEAAQALGTSAGTFTIADGTTINATSGAIDMSATDNPIAINGNFTFTGSNNLDLGDGAITMGASRSITTSANTLTMGGVLTAATSTLTSAGAGGLAFDAQAVTLSGLVISAGTLTSTSGVLSLAGDFDNDATFTHNNGNVTFNGTTDQNLGTSAGTQTFYDLTINNTGADGSDDITLADPVIVANSLTLTDGHLYTDATNVITFNDGATTSSGTDGSHIVGQVSKIGDDAFVFPTGNGTYFARIGISAPDNAADQFTAKYTGSAYSDLTIIGFNNVSNVEYWDLDEDNDAGAGTSINITLYWEDGTRSGIDDNSSGDLIVAHFTGADWVDAGQSAISSSTPGSVTSNAVSSFSPFTFGSGGAANNPLPVELLSFEANYNGTAVDLTWSTATEINNNYFTICRSTDGINYIEIANIPSKALNGNSTSTLNYRFEDTDVTTGTYYYRLKQTDFDGSLTYSQVEDITIHGSDEFEFNISPNPSGGATIAALINANKGDEVELTIYDMLGQFIFDFDINVEHDDAELYPITFPEQLAPGTYIIRAECGDKNISRRMVID